jgi:hypothetical protein
LKAGALREVVITSLALLVATSLPYIYGFLSEPPDKWFSGVVFNVHDTAQYLSWMRESATRFFIENKLTSEPNPPIFVNLHWWIPGRTAALLGLSLRQVYQIFRMLAVPLYVGVTYWLCGLFFVERRRRRFAFWLTTLGSGLGWIWVVYKQFAGELLYPQDVYTTPGNTFWVLLASPHLTLALALTLLVLGLAWLGHERRHFGLSLAAAGVALFLGLGHIYDLVTVWAVLGTFGVLLTLRDGFRWRTFVSLAVVVLVSAPASLYFGWVSSPANPMWQQALAQYDNLGSFTPSPLHLLVLLGITFFLAMGGFVRGLGSFDKLRAGLRTGSFGSPSTELTCACATPARPVLGPRRDQGWREPGRASAGRAGSLGRQSRRDLFLKGWFIVNLILIYLPLRFQVMLLTGFQFVLAALATDFVFDRLIPWLEARWARERRQRWLARERLVQWVPALLLLAILPTNLYLFAWRFVDLHRYTYPFYLHRDEVSAMRWLELNADPDEVVLSAFVTGHYIPGLAGNRAFLANAVMTIDFNHKREIVEDFFDAATPDAERQAVVQKYGIRYIFFGPAEREGGAYDPVTSPWLTLAFSNSNVDIYRVEDGTPQ